MKNIKESGKAAERDQYFKKNEDTQNGWIEVLNGKTIFRFDEINVKDRFLLNSTDRDNFFVEICDDNAYWGDSVDETNTLFEIGYWVSNVEYVATLMTGDMAHADTDAYVYIQFFGQNGATEEILLDDVNRSDYEIGQEDVFYFNAPSVGKITKAKIRIKKFNDNTDWFLETIRVDVEKNSYNFKVNRWFGKESKENPIYELEIVPDLVYSSLINVDYVITVVTGDMVHADTDAYVYIQFFGKKGKTQEYLFDDVNRGDFDRNAENVFTHKAPSVGTIGKAKIRIGRYEDYNGTDWFLRIIRVDVENKSYKFLVYRWFAKADEETPLYELEITPKTDNSETEEPVPP